MIVLGYKSALACWRQVSACRRQRPAPSAMTALGRHRPELSALADPSLPTCGGVLDILVPKDSLRSHQTNASLGGRVKAHVWSAPIPRGALLSLGGDVLVPSPEFCFLQMAGICDLPELVLIGFELCGTYSLETSSERGFVDRPQLTSVSRLVAFVDRMSGCRGVKRARRALRLILDASASPRESHTTIFLCFPVHLGGYGIDLPSLNEYLNLDPRRNLTGSVNLCGDLVWREKRLVVEYDSDLFHTGAERIAHDSARRTALLSMGYTVITVTNKQLALDRDFDRVARAVAHALGRRVHKPSVKELNARYRLRLSILRSM